MTDWTEPRTYTQYELMTKAILDVHIRDNLKHLYERFDLVVCFNDEVVCYENAVVYNI